MSLSCPPRRVGVRLGFASFSVVTLVVSSFSAFVSLTTIGSGVGSQMQKDSALATNRNDTIQRLNVNQEVAKAQAGVGLVGSRVVLQGYLYTDGTFFQAISDRSDAIKRQKDNTVIRDAGGREIGYVKKGFVCDSIANTCQPI